MHDENRRRRLLPRHRRRHREPDAASETVKATIETTARHEAGHQKKSGTADATKRDRHEGRTAMRMRDNTRSTGTEGRHAARPSVRRPAVSNRRYLQKTWQKVVAGLAVVVVFCTTYGLMLPAVAMTSPTCGQEEHQHTAACYEQQLTCTLQETASENTLEGGV